MHLQENSCEKYQVMGYVTSMHIDTGMRFSMNFGHEKFYWESSWNLLVPVLGCPCSQEIKFLRISWEMLDQYY